MGLVCAATGEPPLSVAALGSLMLVVNVPHPCSQHTNWCPRVHSGGIQLWFVTGTLEKRWTLYHPPQGLSAVNIGRIFTPG